MAAPKGACIYALALPLGRGRKKSDQSGFLPILLLIFFLLIYERQQKTNHTTLIFWEEGYRAGGDDLAAPF